MRWLGLLLLTGCTQHLTDIPENGKLLRCTEYNGTTGGMMTNTQIQADGCQCISVGEITASVLIELDTGKSRTVINPQLASELGLKRGTRGVEIRALRLGDLSFRVPSAKEVDQTGIDPSLPESILVGVGSDILSRFVWTVDYETGAVWLPVSD